MTKSNCNMITPFRMLCLNNFPFIEEEFDAIDNYQLLSKIVEKLNEVIKNENNLNSNFTNLYNAFVELKSYVDNYFENLDVQDEVNAKLDEMAEQGTLQEIIASYLNSKAIFGFDNVASMKESTNLIDGSYAETLGYYAKNDGGKSLYKVREITNADVVDEKSIIALADPDLIAEIVTVTSLNVAQFGAKGDGETDDTTAIQSAIDYCSLHDLKLYFCKKTYIVSNLSVNTSGYLKLIIDGNNGVLKSNGTGYILTFTNSTSKNIIENIEINGNFTASGIRLEKTQRMSIKNVIFHYCIIGLDFENVWYGNVDNNCLFDSCLTSIKLAEDLTDQYYGENNTLEFNNFSIDAHNVQGSSFGLTGTKSIGVEINSLVHSVKFNGVIFENIDYAVKSGETHRNGSGAIYGILSFTNCYFEDCNEYWLDWSKTDASHYNNFRFIIENNNYHPFAELKAKLDCSEFTMLHNMPFKIETYVDNRNLKLITDINDFYIDTTNYNYTTKVNKADSFIVRSTTMNYSTPATAQTYPSNVNSTLAKQNDEYDAYQFYKNSNNITIKNSKAYSINSKNILFDDQGIVPVGLIINGTNNKKYMLSTDDGTTLNLIEMNNFSRMYERTNSYDAYWLYANRSTLPNGYKAYCNDIEKNVKLVKTNDSAEWWTDETNSYICIGTSESLYTNLSNQPSLYWRACWDLSFNHAVFLHGDRYNSAYDYFMNNNPNATSTQILAYGNIASRPATPTYKSIYYAIDENKYYVWDLVSWTEITKIM